MKTQANPAKVQRMITPRDILANNFGHKSFRPGQADIIDLILDGKNVLAVMPTGAGTVSYTHLTLPTKRIV